MIKVGLYISSEKPEAINWAKHTAQKLKDLGAECCAIPEIVKIIPELSDYIKPLKIDEYSKFADIVISFGGDGTMLAAVRSLIHTEIPIMGINVGKLGFLAEYSVNEISSTLQNLMNGNYRVVDRVVIETKHNDETIYILNDAVIEKKDSSRMITVQAFTNEHFIGDYRADGLILTTPTGSTAYSLSCGGPIITPATGVFCLTPICPHSLTHRPLIISDSNEVRLKVFSTTGEANFVADGQLIRTLKNDESIVFNRSELRAKLIKPLNTTYYDLLRKKLLWAANATTEISEKF